VTTPAALTGPGALADRSAEAGHLRARAEHEAARLPPLLVKAEQLAAQVLLGEHGRRRAGMGSDFWQYRPAQPGDSRRLIDPRRSAKGDQQFVREREMQIAQSVHLWADLGASMQFSSSAGQPQKIERARVLGLAISILMLRAGERVGLTGTRLPPRGGEGQILRLAQALTHTEAEDYAPPEHRAMVPHTKAVFLSDFLGPFDELHTALAKAADRGLHGVLLQIMDPSEESFPYQGRTVFQSASGSLRHETLKASGLRAQYLERLAERRDALDRLCRSTGWQLGLHHTGEPAMTALMWLYHALNGHRS
jgi:uncharacterized protein (DUF58 family)